MLTEKVLETFIKDHFNEIMNFSYTTTALSILVYDTEYGPELPTNVRVYEKSENDWEGYEICYSSRLMRKEVILNYRDVDSLAYYKSQEEMLADLDNIMEELQKWEDEAQKTESEAYARAIATDS